MTMTRRTFLSAAAAGAALSAVAADNNTKSPRGNFEFGERRRYMMPAHFGERPAGKASLDYLDVTTMVVSYRTDADRLQGYLPAPYEVREPVLTVFYSKSREVEWLAGGGYNLLGVNAEVRFNGERDQVDGSYCLVLWEDDTDAIISGREILGIPKIFADIEDHKVLKGEWTTTASLRGHKIVDMTLDGLTPVEPEPAAEMKQAMTASNWMGWKYIPNIGRPGAALSHATLVPTRAMPERIWTASGTVEWHKLTWEQNPTQSHIANALADLPIVEYVAGLVYQGATSLFVPDHQARELH